MKTWIPYQFNAKCIIVFCWVLQDGSKDYTTLRWDNIRLEWQNISSFKFTQIFISSLFLVFMCIKYLKTVMLLMSHLVNLQCTYFTPLIFLHKSIFLSPLIMHVSPLWTPSNTKTFHFYFHFGCWILCFKSWSF